MRNRPWPIRREPKAARREERGPVNCRIAQQGAYIKLAPTYCQENQGKTAKRPAIAGCPTKGLTGKSAFTAHTGNCHSSRHANWACDTNGRHVAAFSREANRMANIFLPLRGWERRPRRPVGDGECLNASIEELCRRDLVRGDARRLRRASRQHTIGYPSVGGAYHTVKFRRWRGRLATSRLHALSRSHRRDATPADAQELSSLVGQVS